MVKKVHVVDEYHGMKVYDPYRWLEDIHSEDTHDFIEEHNEATEEFIKSYNKYNDIKERMTSLWRFQSYSAPEKKGEYYYFFYNDGSRNQPCFYRAKEIPGEKELLVDPNIYSEDGTSAIGTVSVNPLSGLLAYSISEKGSDWQVIRVLDMENKGHLEDEIHWCRFTDISWIPYNNSFIYSRYPEKGPMSDEEVSYHNMVCIHKVGTPQNSDIVLVDGKERTPYSHHVYLTEDNDYMIVVKNLGTSSQNLISIKNLKENQSIDPFEGKDGSWQLLGNEGSKFYFLTNYKAPKRRIIEIDLHDGYDEDDWREIMEEDSSDTISFASYNGGYIAMAIMHDAHHKLTICHVNSRYVYDYDMGILGAISEISNGENGKEIFFKFASYLQPDSIYRYDLEENQCQKVLEPEIDFDFKNYETNQVFVESKDGTKIPMFLSHRKGIKLDGGNKTLLYSYGGFNLNRIPEFRIPEIVWMELGGVFAVANIRGGNEYGEQWHEAAILEKKQNCFDDFIACGQWLIDNKYTNNKLLAIRGRSNGGLLTGACMVQRPDLYGAVITQVGVLDMLRYHKYTIGRFWIPEYGDAETNEEDFKFLYKYSPLHNIRCGAVYPPVLVATGDCDDRVLPCHSYKFVATLEEVASGENPILLRVEKNAGHGQGKPISKLIEVEADIYSFLDKVLK